MDNFLICVLFVTTALLIFAPLLYCAFKYGLWGDFTPSEEARTHWKNFVKCITKEFPVTRLNEVGKPFKVNVREVLGE